MVFVPANRFGYLINENFMISYLLVIALEVRRGVAQTASAPALGAGGRWFKSSRPDHFFIIVV